MYDNGWGVPEEYKEAVKWHRLAAEHGQAVVQHNLGLVYATGKGILADYVLAHMWLSIATANGAVNGADNRDSLAKKMTSEQHEDQTDFNDLLFGHDEYPF